MRITIDGLTTSYQSIGRQESTLLLLHGWANTWEAWSPLIPQLSRKHRLIIPDLPGFGASESPSEGWGMAEYVQWLEKFLGAINIDSLSGVLGHSFGGKLAAFSWWQEEHTLPMAQNGFFLIDPSGIMSELPASRKILRAAAQAVPHSIKRGVLAQFRRKVYTQVLKETDYFTATAFQEATLNRILNEDIRDWAVQADLPLHLCWGEKDTAVPLWMAYEFAGISNRADVFVVPNTGHFPHHEKTALISSWLEANHL